MRSADQGEVGGCGVRTTVPGGGVRRLAWPALVALTAVAAAVPLWSSTFLPFQDAPQHVAAVRVLADYGDATFAFQRWFEVDLRRSQYLGFYLPAAVLAKLVGPQAACRLVLTLVVFALPTACWLLLRSFGRDTRLSVFAPAAFHTVPLYMGFFNFVASVPVAIAVVALVERELRAPSRARAVLLAVAAAALFWLHPSAVAFVLGAAAVLAVTSALPWHRRARAMMPLVPAAALLGGWAAVAHAARADSEGSRPFWQPFREQLLDMGRFGNVLVGHSDELFALVIFSLWFAAAVLRGSREPPERWWRLPILAALILAAYLVTPVGRRPGALQLRRGPLDADPVPRGHPARPRAAGLVLPSRALRQPAPCVRHRLRPDARRSQSPRSALRVAGASRPVVAVRDVARGAIGGDTSGAMSAAFQPSLFSAEEVSFDSSFAELRRLELDERSWVDHAPGWVCGSDALFDRIVASRNWAQRTRRMYDGRVLEPRLTAPWSLRSGERLEPSVLEEMRLCLSRRYGVVFDSIGFNWYRDGRDSVAWHSDKIRKEIEEPIVVLVSLGEPRKFLLRPKGGGRSTPFQLGRGDLLVTGGKAQREWEHCVPKVARAGPRISLAFRHGMEQRAYD